MRLVYGVWWGIISAVLILNNTKNIFMSSTRFSVSALVAYAWIVGRFSKFLKCALLLSAKS